MVASTIAVGSDAADGSLQGVVDERAPKGEVSKEKHPAAIW